MTTEEILALPTMHRPLPVRSGLTAFVTYSENTGEALTVVVEGLDDGFRPIRLGLRPETIRELARVCSITLSEGDRL